VRFGDVVPDLLLSVKHLVSAAELLESSSESEVCNPSASDCTEGTIYRSNGRGQAITSVGEASQFPNTLALRFSTF
jgi:hypothetical protein